MMRPLRSAIVDALQSRRILLLLDNCEHLVEACARLADTLLRACPRLRILATSREPLAIAGEATWRVPSLALPATAGTLAVEALARYEAVQLFVECAHRADSRFVAQDLASIVRICQLVQGMPLAVELAAGWSAILTPSEIAGEIAQSVDFLVTTQRHIPERLQSVRAVFEARAATRSVSVSNAASRRRSIR